MPTLRLEMKRALSNRWFVLASCALTGIALFAAVARILYVTEQLNIVVYPFLDTSYWYISCLSSYSSWIAVNHLDTATELFFVLVPLLVLTGYSWSLASDLKSGYLEQLSMRTSRVRCYAARWVATFISGGVLVAVPLLANFLALTLFLPSWEPSLVDQFYTSVGGASDVNNNALFTSLFYTNPLLYVVARTLLDFVLCGLWATVVLALSFVTRNRIALVALPYITLLLVKHLGQRLYVVMRTNGYDGFGHSITLFDQLRAAPDGYFCPGWLTLLCAAFMLVFSIGVPLAMRRRDIL